MLFQNQAADFVGLEFAAFKLKVGVSEADLIAMSKQVDNAFLSKEKELLAHFLLKGKDGIYADVALATSQEKAEEICQLWLKNDIALKYLDLIDQASVDITFWSRIT